VLADSELARTLFALMHSLDPKRQPSRIRSGHASSNLLQSHCASYSVFERKLASGLDPEVGTGSREENASKQKTRARVRFIRTGKGSNVPNPKFAISAVISPERTSDSKRTLEDYDSSVDFGSEVLLKVSRQQ